MPGYLNFGIIQSALSATQQAINVTSNNVANATTPGYRRQEAVLDEISPASDGKIGSTNFAIIGNGVRLDAVMRAQTNFVDRQLRASNGDSEYSSSLSKSLSQVESCLAEPGTSGISAALDKFWNSWNDLSTSPESPAVRATVISSGQTLANRLNNLYMNIKNAQSGTDDVLTDDVKQINEITHRIGDLNAQITDVLSSGAQPNNMMDQRDQLLDQLSGLVGIQVNGNDQSGIIVSVAGRTIIQGSQVSDLETQTGAGGNLSVCWKSDGTPINLTTGSMKGVLDARSTMEGYVTNLNTFTQELINRVNTLHSSGMDLTGTQAGNFFAGTDASTIAVDPTILNSPSKLAAAGSTAPGDNSVAVALAGVKDEVMPALGNVSLTSSYANFVTQIGGDVKKATSDNEVNSLNQKQLTAQRESISGVSMDEEMMNMMKFQQSYSAAARVFSVISSMMDTTINMAGNR